MSGLASGLVLGLLLATVYAAVFHLVFGGRATSIVTYVVAAWLGFAAGHVVGDVLNINLLKLGAVHLLSASAGAWLALFAGRWLGRT